MFTFGVVMLSFVMLATAVGIFNWDTKNSIIDRLVILLLIGSLLIVSIWLQEVKTLRMIVYEDSGVQHEPHSYTV